MHGNDLAIPKADEQGCYVRVMIAGDFDQLYVSLSACGSQFLTQPEPAFLPIAVAGFCGVSYRYQNVDTIQQSLHQF